MVFDILKYASWAITTLIPIAGQFFWKFTEDATDKPGGYRWTAAGKVALVLTLLGVAISLGMSVASDAQDARDKAALSASNIAIQEKLDSADADAKIAAGSLTTMQSELTDLETQINSLVKNTTTQPFSATERQRVLQIQSQITKVNGIVNAAISKANKLPKR